MASKFYSSTDSVQTGLVYLVLSSDS